jgi:hypothetical protein
MDNLNLIFSKLKKETQSATTIKTLKVLKKQGHWYFVRYSDKNINSSIRHKVAREYRSLLKTINKKKRTLNT